MTSDPTHRVRIAPDGELIVLARAPGIERWSWALYDFANTIFSMNIATLYFAVWIVTERGASNTAFSLATSLSSAVVLVAAPFFGAISDARRRRKPWVVWLTLACVAATALLHPLARLPLPRATLIFLLLAAFAVANTAYQLALPFYNAMLPELVPESERGRLSGLGTALGYVGSIVGVLVMLPLVQGGWEFLGRSGREAVFLPTALLFLVFSLPFFLFCHDALPAARAKAAVRLRDVFTGTRQAFRDARRYPGLLRFLLASYCYQDALGTAIAFMAIFAVSVLGLPPGGEATLFVALTVPAVIGSFSAGLVSDRVGPRRTLFGILVAWTVGLLAVALSPSLPVFWASGALLGFVFGGIWTTERPLLLTLVPDSEAGRFFGLLALSGRAAAIAGPLLWALLVDGLSSRIGKETAYRIAIGSLALFMVAAILLLRGVPERGLPSTPARK
ncbi:MAG: MFS transporter [Thermoanaerobaculia bacterium]|nr:MFS transporter [Thermoanaerobaculia bacterium]